MKRLSCAVIGCILLVGTSGCTKSTPDEAGRTPEAAGLMFDQPDFPFTFRYPQAFFQNAALQIRPGQSNGPEFSFEMSEHNGILIRQAAAAEFSNERLAEKLKDLVMKDGKGGDVRTEACAGREVVVVEKDIQVATQPPIPGHSKSYAFGYGGRSWQVEFYSTEQGREAVSQASALFARTLGFKQE